MDILNKLKTQLMEIDPVVWVENNLRVDGKVFKLRNSSRNYLLDLYRYIVFEASKLKGKPVVIVKSRKVEMSTTMMALSFYFLTGGFYKNRTILHVFPILEQARNFSNDRFDGMMRQSVNDCVRSKIDKEGTYATAHKQFKDFNQIYIEGASKEANRLRSTTCDILLLDEVQDILKPARENVSETITASDMRLEVNFGTPKEKGSDFEKVLWESSDQRYYHVKCISCGNYFVITLENFKQGFMIECPKCKKLQDKRKAIIGGKWIPTKTSVQTHRVGFFFNQLMVPYIDRETVARKQDDMGPRQFNNEVLGLFYSGTMSSLTYEQVIKYMVTDTDGWGKSFSTRAEPPKITFMGVDWGGRSAGSADRGRGSYTVVAIISITNDGKYFIEFAQRLNHTNDVKAIEFISNLIRRFNVQDVACDMGYGSTKVQLLQADWLDRVKSVWYAANTKKTYNYHRDTMMITVDRDVTLEELYEEIKQAKWILPMKDPEKSEWLAQHVSNVDISTKNIHGMVRRSFGKLTGLPDDGLHALNYARIAFLFRKTMGFSRTGMKYGSFYGGGRSMPRPIIAEVHR